AVLAAIQRNGPNGPWWNAATGKWQPGPAWNGTSVTATGGNARWSIKAPVTRAGAVWHVFARAKDSDGEVDPAGASETETVSPVASGARLGLSAASAAPGSAVTASGKGYKAGETVQVSVPGTILAKAKASATGSFSTTVKVPGSTPYGTSGLDARGLTSGRDA